MLILIYLQFIKLISYKCIKNVLIFYIYIYILYLLQRFLNLFVLKMSSFIAVNARTDIERRPNLSF